MKTLKLLLILIVFGITLQSCTKNERAKSWGGTADVNIESNYKVVNVTWKENDLWILVRPMTPTDVPETLTFYEKSSWGVFNGKYIIHEQKSK